jgi:hypothetical protein
MTNYNGWTNYATWRINLEIFDGMEMKEMGWHRLNARDLAITMKEYVQEVLEIDTKEGLTLDYARAFVADVSFYEIAKQRVEESDEEEEAA